MRAGGLFARVTVCRAIWPHMVGILLTYTVTLSLFPGVETALPAPPRPCWLAEWLPLLTLATFNSADLLGKVNYAEKLLRMRN